MTRFAAAPLTVLALLLPAGAASAPEDVVTAQISPPLVQGGSTAGFTMQVTNSAASVSSAHRAEIAVPAGFTVSGPTISATTVGAGACIAATWALEAPYVSGPINLQNTGAPESNLCPGGILTVNFSAIAPGADVPAAVWTTQLVAAEPFPTPASPSVSVDATPPSTTLDPSGPNGVVNETAATFSFSSEANATFECDLDSGGFAPCDSPKDYTGLADGAHDFTVRAIDAVGNIEPAPSVRSWTVDTDAPDTTIESAPDTQTNDTSPAFAFTSDEGGSEFECRLDGGMWEACNSPKDYTGLGEGLHTFEVIATDAAGNADPTADAHTWTIDVTEPETTLTPPLPADPTNQTTASFSFSASEPTSRFECSLDGTSPTTCQPPLALDLDPGSHTFSVRAVDVAGNTDTAPAAHTWTIDVTAPVTTILGGPADPTTQTSATFTFSAEIDSAYECRLDGGSWAACSSPATYPGLADGPHGFEVRATDPAANTDASPAAWAWTVDTNAPDTALDSGPSGLTASSSSTFAFSSEPGASFECSLDDAAFGPCVSPALYTGLGEGAHTFDVRARDALGNTDTTPAHAEWTVDTVAPETTIDDGPSGTVTKRGATLTFSSEPGVTFRCSLDGAAFAACSSPVATGALSLGAHGFRVEATDAAGNVDPSPAERLWTVEDPTASVDDVVVPETGDAVFTVTLSGASDQPITLDYATAGESATAGADYASAAGSLSFAPDETTKTVAVAIAPDALDEADETFTVTLSNASNAALGDAEGRATISDDDALPALSVDDVTVTEGNAGTTNAAFTITLAPVSGRQVTVDYATVDGTAAAGSDYASTTGTVTFEAGETTKTVAVAVNGDTFHEADNSFTLALTTPTHATLGDDAGLGTIVNDEAAPQLSISDEPAIDEENGSAGFTVSRDRDSELAVTVDYASVDETAHAPADYGAVAGTVTFAAGQPGDSSQSLFVPIAEDALDEDNETFEIVLSNPSNAAILQGTGLGTILDDDPLPTLSINDVTVTEGDTGTTHAIFDVTLNAPSGRQVTVDHATGSGSATAPADYTAGSGTLTFAAGETTQQVSVPVQGDVLDEHDEGFVIALTNPSAASIADDEGSATITDDDVEPALSIADVTIAEGDSGSANAVFTVSLGAPSGREVSVAYATANGSAASPGDYTGASGTLSFAAGDTTEQVVVPVHGDVLDETDGDTFFVNLSAPLHATIADDQGLGTITDDDQLPSLSVNDVTVTEGNAGTTNAVLTVTLSPLSGREVTVDYATGDGSASAPADYAATSGTLSFDPGQTSRTITVPVNGDLANEGTETYALTLSNAPRAAISDNQGVGTILDDDGQPTLAINNVTVTEGNAGPVDATMTVSLNPASGQTVSVGYSTADGTAKRPGDYAATGNSLVFAPGQTTMTVIVPVNGDLLDEIDESFTVELSNAVNAAIGDPSGLVTITDDDAPPTMRVGDATVTEGNTGIVNAPFAVTLDVPSGQVVTVDYATGDSSATAPDDYTAVSGSLVFNPGETTKTVDVAVHGDLLDESNETFVLSLTNRVNANFGDSAGLGTINDDDPFPALSIADVTVTEGDAGTATANVTVALSPVSGRPVTVNFATTPGSATTPADFAATSGQLTFAAGQTTSTVAVPVAGDLLDEIDETFTVTLATPDFATISDGSATVTIGDDDPLPSLAVGDVNVNEGDSGTATATFTVSLEPVSGRPVAVHYTTVNGTAVAPADYAATNGDLTFLPGETTKTIPVTVNADALDEVDETFTLTLSAPGAAGFADDTGTATITDDDPPPALSVNDSVAAEPDSGTSNLTFTVSLSAPSGRPVSVDYATADGTATAPADYLATTGTVTFAPGQTTRPVVVPVSGDLLDEINETFVLDLANAVDATIADPQGVGTITDDDVMPTVNVGDATVLEGNTGTTSISLPVTLNAPSGRPVTVDFATGDGTATSPTDYTATSGTLTFAPGDTTENVVVTVIGDALDEADDTFTVELSNPGNASLGDEIGGGTIVDDDATPTLAIGNATVLEGNGGTVDATFHVALGAPSGRTVTVSYTTNGGTATSPIDFGATSGTLTFLPGETARTIVVPVAGDVLDEIDETFTVTLSSPVNATLADDSGLGTIADDDATPSLSVNDVSVAEGNSGTVNAVFTVTLSAASGRTVTVDYATTDGTAKAPADYAALPTASLNFVPGQTTRTVTVAVASDTIDEFDESYTLGLSSAGNATIADPAGLGTIVDNDPQPSVSVDDVTVTEGDSGTVEATFDVTLSEASGLPVAVDYATSDVNATAPADYVAVAGTLSFAPGDTTKTVAVTVNADVLDELNETFTVQLSNPVNAATGHGATGTITDNDPQPALAIGDATITEGDSGIVSATFTVNLSTVSGRIVTVNYATASGTATAPADYTPASGTLTFAPGDTAKTITVSVVGDVLDEPDTETFVVNLSNALGASVTDPQGTGTIADDDATPTLTINDVTVAEGDSGTVNANFTIGLSAASGQTVTVNYATANQSAIAPGDYVAKGGTLTFAAGQTSQQLAIVVNGDLLDETSETYAINLSGPTGATLADFQGIGTIIDDDGVPELFIDDVTVNEGNSGTVNAVFTVALTAPSGQQISVGWTTADETANAPLDYTTNGGGLVFNPGVTTRTLTVAVKSDVLDEDNETFLVNLSDAVNAQITGGSGTGTITDDDAPPALSVNDVTISEGDAGTVNAIFAVTLGAPSGKAITVQYATADGTAGAPADYQATSGTLTFAPGETSKDVTVPVIGDAIDEVNELFSLNLAGPTNATIADASGMGTITDNDPSPTIGITDATVTEGNAGTTDATFTVLLSGASGRPIAVNYATGNGSAAAPADYTSTSGVLDFAVGETSKTITVAVKGDLLDEIDETFTVTLSLPAGAVIADGSATGTITDDDALPVLSVNDVTVTEGDTGTVAAVFTLGLDAPSGRNVDVHFATTNGTAVAPADYVARNSDLTFAPGETTKTVTVTVNGDLLDEVDEAYAFDLSAPVNATIGDGHGVGAILDDDLPPALSIDDVTVTEGNSGTVNANFSVTLSAPSGQTVSVGYGTADGSAGAGTDYTGTGGNVVFTPGLVSQQVTVQVTSDVIDELDETFVVNLSGPVLATIADQQGVGSILDDDDPPSIAIGDVSVTEGNTGTATATFTATLSRPSGRPIAVDYTTENGSAVTPADYQGAAGTLSFSPGQTTRTATILVNSDLLDEENETYFVNLSGATNSTIGDPQAVGTITDDDALPAVGVADAVVAEGDTGTASAAFTVTLNAPSGRSVSVDYATSNGSALAPGDYTATSGTLTFAAGETTKTLNVAVKGDALDEIDETFTLTLTNPVNGAFSDSSALGTITDDDPSPGISIGNATVLEGNSGTVTATFTVTLGAPSGRAVSVNFATANDTASTPADYEATSGALSFAAGETTKTVTVNVNGDALDEPNESFLVNLTAPVNATLADGQGVGTITDDEGVPSLRVDDVTVNEGQSGTVNANFTVSLSNPSGQTVSVAYATVDGTATAGADYTAASGNVVFVPGVLTQPVTVQVKSDTVDEFDESFTVSLSGATNASIGDGFGLGTITDDDLPANVSVTDATVTEGNTGTVSATFTVKLNTGSAKAITVGYATANGSATAPADYAARSGTLSFPAGETTKSVEVPVNGDGVNEVNETFTLELDNAVNANVADATGVGTITDDDPPPTLAIADVTVAEGDAGTTDAVFTVSLSAASGRTVTVNYATANGGATGADYVATSGPLSFAAGETSKTIVVPVNGDLLDEADETFSVNLSGAVGATVADGNGVATITDDDAPPALSVGDVTVAEGNSGTTSANFVVTLSAPSGRTVTVNYATANGSAIAPADYQARSGSLTFTPGQTSQPVVVTVNGDTIDEVAETYSLNLTAPTMATFADAQGAGTIIDDDGLPTLFVNDITVVEGNSGNVNANFTVSLSAASGLTVGATLTTAEGTALEGTATPGVDYTTGTGGVVFTPGQTSRIFTVHVRGELVDELDETFGVILSEPSNADIGDAVGVGTIADDDAPPTATVNNITVVEGNGDTTNAVFTVALSRASGLVATVDYATADGTATAPADYEASTGTVTFAAGEVSKQVNVPVTSDLLDEDPEAFTLSLTNPTNSAVGDGEGTASITDDDPLPSLSIGDVTVVEGNAGLVEASFVVTLGAPSGRTVTVDFATADRTAITPEDYQAVAGTLTFASGETTKRIAVPVHGDTQVEPAETFVVNLFGPAAAAVADAQAVATIATDDAAPPPPGPPPPPPVAPPPPPAPPAPPPTPPAPPPPPPPAAPRTPKAGLTAPRKNAVVTAPPTLRWIAVKNATYYNVQLWRISSTGQAKAAKKGKILSAWPKGTSLKLRKTWKFGKETFGLTPGKYKWYVWPGLGKRSANRYGAPIGESSFTVKTKTVKKATTKKR